MIDINRYLDNDSNSIYDALSSKLDILRKKYGSTIPYDKFKEIVIESLDLYKDNSINDYDFEEFLITRLESECIDSNDYVSDDLLKEYLKDISIYPLLSREEEVELAHRIKNGDMAAREKFIKSNLRLVVSLARRYNRGVGLSLLDIIQEGNFGLMTAVDKFDPDKGYRFSTYATWWILQGVARSNDNHSRTIRLPVHLSEKLLKFKAGYKDLKTDLGREPSINELANEMGISISKATRLYELLDVPVSLNELVGDDKNTELSNFIPASDVTPEDIAIANGLKNEIYKILDRCKLNDRERQVIILRYGLEDNIEHTLEELSSMYNLSRERIRQIEIKAMYKIRKNTSTMELAAYSDSPTRAEEFLKAFRKEPFSNKDILKSSKIYNKEYNKKESFINAFFKDYTKEQVRTMLNCLTDDEKRLILRDLSNDDTLSAKEIKTIHSTLTTKMRQSLEVKKKRRDNSQLSLMGSMKDRKQLKDTLEFILSDEFNKETLDSIKQYLISPKYLNMLKHMDGRDALIGSLKLGLVEGVEFTNEKLIEIFDVDEEEINTICSKVLKNSKIKQSNNEKTLKKSKKNTKNSDNLNNN